MNFYLFSLCNKSKPKMNGDNYLKTKEGALTNDKINIW